MATLSKEGLGDEEGRAIEFVSRVCEGMKVDRTVHLAELLRASGLNILGRSNTPEYSMSGTAENALTGNTANPWRQG